MEVTCKICGKMYKGRAAKASLRCHRRRQHTVYNRCTVVAEPSSELNEPADGAVAASSSLPASGIDESLDLGNSFLMGPLPLELGDELKRFLDGFPVDGLFQGESGPVDSDPPAVDEIFHISGPVLTAVVRSARRLAEEEVLRQGAVRVLAIRFPQCSSQMLEAVYDGFPSGRSAADLVAFKDTDQRDNGPDESEIIVLD